MRITRFILPAIVVSMAAYFGGNFGFIAGATAEPLVSPVKAREREAYYPNSEDLAADEMRVKATLHGFRETTIVSRRITILVSSFIFKLITSMMLPCFLLWTLFVKSKKPSFPTSSSRF